MAITNNKNHNQLTNLELSIQISLSGLSFCVLQKHTNTITTLKQFDFDKKLNPFEVLHKLINLFDTDINLQDDFKKINIVYTNELSTLVPKPLFKKDCLADYLKFNSKILKTDFIAYDNIESINGINVYIPYVNINNYIYERFGSFTYKHASTVLIENILRIEKNTNDIKVYTNVNQSHFEIITIKKGKLLLYNTFEYSTKEDFIYYILFIVEQLKLNPETLNLILLGYINKGDELYTIVYKYIRHISFAKPTKDYKHLYTTENNYSNFILLNSF